MNNGTALFCVVVPIIFLIVYYWAKGRENEQARRALDTAREAYQDALKRLKADPTNPDTKELALRAGRRYASLTRENKGATLFDEVALGNDISAATAAATVAQAIAPAPPAPSDVTERLRRLDALREQGVITDAEHTQRRAEILKDI